MSTDSKYNLRYVWNSEDIRSGEPTERLINLAYNDPIEKVLMSMEFTAFNQRYSLNHRKPATINGVDVDTSGSGLEFKREPAQGQFIHSLKDFEITSLVKTSPSGENNKVSVNYEVGGSWFGKKSNNPIGKLLLFFTIHWSPIKDQPMVPPSKFCMHCGRSIICTDFIYCPYCGQRPPMGGQAPKTCANCNDLIPPTAKFCEQYGHRQPGF